MSRRGKIAPWVTPVAVDEPANERATDSDPGGTTEQQDELARVIEEVRQARRRLTALVEVVRSGRPEREEREQRWRLWRDEMQRLPVDLPGSKVH